MSQAVQTTKLPVFYSMAAIVISLLGLADAAYLTSKHYAGTVVPCNLAGGCETVLNSTYSEIYGVPTALLGVIGYFLAFSLTILVYFEHDNLWKLFGVLSSFMFLASLGFVYLQAFVIQAYCQYCLLSAVTSTILFIIFLASLFLQKR